MALCANRGCALVEGEGWKADDVVRVRRKVFVSFGGLLLYMEGPYKNLTPLRIDYVYLCMKK